MCDSPTTVKGIRRLYDADFAQASSKDMYNMLKQESKATVVPSPATRKEAISGVTPSTSRARAENASLHEGKTDLRVQYMIEELFTLRKRAFAGHAGVPPEMDLELHDELRAALVEVLRPVQDVPWQVWTQQQRQDLERALAGAVCVDGTGESSAGAAMFLSISEQWSQFLAANPDVWQRVDPTYVFVDASIPRGLATALPGVVAC
eukprot:m51a1_g3601 hypothetical protein (206) ;mRNA; r:23611-25679